MTICHLYRQDVRLVVIEPLATRCHMTCCSRINDPIVRRDVRVHDVSAWAVSICFLVAAVLIIILLVTAVARDMSLLSAPEALYFFFFQSSFFFFFFLSLSLLLIVVNRAETSRAWYAVVSVVPSCRLSLYSCTLSLAVSFSTIRLDGSRSFHSCSITK